MIEVINIQKPWGQEFHFLTNEQGTVKILEVNPRQELSYQSHAKREEYWRCIKNSVRVVIDDTETTLQEGDEILIPLGAKHQLKGTNTIGQVLEVISGVYEAEDIIRYSDKYGREGTTAV